MCVTSCALRITYHASLYAQPLQSFTFHTLLDAVALQSEDDERPAIIYLETDHAPLTISRREFREAVIAHAAGLQHMGIRPRDLVVIAHTQNLESIYAFWGALWCGAIPSMFPTLTEKLDPDIYMHSMAELARLSEVRAIFTTDEFEPQLARACRVRCLDRSIWQGRWRLPMAFRRRRRFGTAVASSARTPLRTLAKSPSSNTAAARRACRKAWHCRMRPC